MDEPDIYIQLYITITEILILQKCHSTITMQETQINLMTEEKPLLPSLKEKMKKTCVEVILGIFATFTVSIILFYHFEAWINRTVYRDGPGTNKLES